MEHIEMLSDADVAEVQKSASLFQGVEKSTADLRSLLDTLCGLRWLTAGMKKKERTLFEAPLFETLGRQPNDAFKLLAHGPDAIDSQTTDGIAHSRTEDDIVIPVRTVIVIPTQRLIRHSRESDVVRHSRERTLSVIPAKATLSVIPAKAGIHLRLTPWTPVFTGVTRKSQKPSVIPAKATLPVIPAQRVIVIPAKAMLSVIPAKAGIHLRPTPWTPVFTGVTNQMTSPTVIPAKAMLSVIPAKAGIHLRPAPWTPVFTGVTNQMTSPTVIPAKAMLSVIPAKAGIHLLPIPLTPIPTGVTIP